MECTGAIVFLPREGGRPTFMLENLLFDPAARWLAQALKNSGVTHFLVVCHQDDRAQAEACFPQGTVFITTGTEDASEQLLTFLHEQEGQVAVITRPVFLTDDSARQLVTGSVPQFGAGETGVCRVTAGALAQDLEAGETFELALLTQARKSDGRGPWWQNVTMLRRDPQHRAEAELMARQSSVWRLMDAGVRIMDPNSVYVGPEVIVEEDTVLLPGAILRGKTSIGRGCEIGPNSMIEDCVIGDGVTVNASQLCRSTVEEGAMIGPFAYIRPNCHVGRGVKVGDFVELKNAGIGEGTKIAHLTYMGDADVGKNVNIGCGTVTVNYDGTSKYRTVIGDNAFIGCNTNLVAPVRIGAGAYTAAGSTITNDVDDNALAIARSRQVVKRQWAARGWPHKK